MPPRSGKHVPVSCRAAVPASSRVFWSIRSTFGVLWAVWLAMLLLASVVRYVMVGSPFLLVSAPPALEGLVSFAIGVLYLTYFWVTTGRTPGKQVLGLRVVDPADRRLRVWRAGARAILCLLSPRLGFSGSWSAGATRRSRISSSDPRSRTTGPTGGAAGPARCAAGGGA